jgi:hypothetical protein
VKLDALLVQGEALHQELGREHYLTLAGLKADPEFQTIYDRYAALASDAALAVAQESGSPPLLEWVVQVRVGRMVASADERQLLWEQGASVSVDDRAIPYLRVPIELANSADREYRRALDVARAETGAQGLNALLRERFQIEHDALEALDLGRYVEAWSALAGIDLAALGGCAREFLERTADMYRDGLALLARQRLGLPISALERADSAWLFRADRYDAAFPAGPLLETATAQMGEMGLDATQGGRIRFDTEEREGKQPRAFCAPVRVPQEVYLVIRPRGGHNDYRTFWHELGHAMHFASVDPELPFSARWLGDNSVTEAYAMLWDHLTIDPRWLERYGSLSRPDARDLAFELAVSELFLVRRYAAKLVYELELHCGDFSGMGTRYAERLTEATGFRYLEDDCLLDVDPGFYAARYLRAWQLEAGLARTFTERYDEDWYRNPRAGEAVRDLMRRGQRDPADRLGGEVTGGDLTFDHVVARLEARLN